MTTEYEFEKRLFESWLEGEKQIDAILEKYNRWHPSVKRDRELMPLSELKFPTEEEYYWTGWSD